MQNNAASREFGSREIREMLTFLTQLGPDRVISITVRPCSRPDGVTGFLVLYWEKGEQDAP